MDSGTKVKKGAARRRSGGGHKKKPETGFIVERSLFERVGTGAPVYLVAVLEYLAAEVLELAGTLQELTKRTVAVSNDEELGTLLKGVTIAHSGVLPNKNPILLPKKSEKAATKQSQVTIKGYQIS
ncbi:predicted protein [Arabidopsis lyrata subsp. lyrata]|uniref:Histone H2A n=1 Tax=Arabidopsis lyrata subsp. lyrata TaxID=81972 RepID=D7M7U6_ARALL|nr:predicted protein [Arabidopsis lyrata subsp. lyrata]